MYNHRYKKELKEPNKKIKTNRQNTTKTKTKTKTKLCKA